MFNLELYTVISRDIDPYNNLALEEYLLQHIPENGCILYLWQNDHTVVIGRNQNPWVECRTSLLKEEGGHLARRLSGGGAVYHDLGNLNFTFLCHEKDYDVSRQLKVIQKAVSYAGIDARFSGRNDLLVDGKKFSGNAFYHSAENAYHHGTLLISSDLNRLQRYLSPPKAKLESKGVSSVRSRVTNLSALSPSLNCEHMKDHLIQAFSEVYGGIPESLSVDDEIPFQKYKSDEWLYGRPMPFTCQMSGTYPWGSIELRLLVKGGSIEGVQVYTDAMEHTLSDSLRAVLTNCPFQATDMINAVSTLENGADIANLIREHNI